MPSTRDLAASFGLLRTVNVNNNHNPIPTVGHVCQSVATRGGSQLASGQSSTTNERRRYTGQCSVCLRHLSHRTVPYTNMALLLDVLALDRHLSAALSLKMPIRNGTS